MLNVYIVEGGIGAGKTFLLEAINGCYIQGKRVIVVKEPVGEWCSTPQGNLLKEFCQDRTGHAFEFQVLVMTTLAEQRDVFVDTDCIYFVERSLHSSHNVFQPVLHQEGFLTDTQNYILGRLYDHLKSSGPVANGIIFLDTPFTVALERIARRNKSADKSLTHQYVSTVRTHYLRYMDNCSLPVLRVTPVDLQGRPPMELIESWIANLESG